MAKLRVPTNCSKPTHVALLRGINVGGKNLLPMAALAKIFASEGCADVVTYIQSGNVLFAATATEAKSLGSRITKRIESEFGFAPPVILRSRKEVRAALAHNPFAATADPAGLYIAFLDRAPTKAARARLDPNRSPPDRFELLGKELHLHLIRGAGETKFTNAYLDAALNVISTMRNWRTVHKLDEMLRRG
jgi:uncharacterized protein (DUF1697 family)